MGFHFLSGAFAFRCYSENALDQVEDVQEWTEALKSAPEENRGARARRQFGFSCSPGVVLFAKMTSQKPTTQLALYRDYMRHIGDRLELFEVIAARFGARSGIYPGSYVHVTPSFVMPRMTYVDMDRRAQRFFQDASVLSFVRRRRCYSEAPQVRFHFLDYREPLEEPDGSCDLLISMWAGFVSQECKRYLKYGGVLVANDSHGDASMAFVDPDYEFVAAVSSTNMLVEQGLAKYFVPKKAQVITAKQIRALGRGIGYTHRAPYYLFRRR